MTGDWHRSQINQVYQEVKQQKMYLNYLHPSVVMWNYLKIFEIKYILVDEWVTDVDFQLDSCAALL